MPPPFDLVPQLLRGAVVTLELTAATIVVAAVFAFIAGLGRLSGHRWVRTLLAVYVEIFRGTSAFVQIFYMFFVLPLVGISLSPFITAVAALGLNGGAYGSEVVRAAVLGVDRGQWEAATALNMSPSTTMRRVILPQAVLAMLPSFGNLAIQLLKGTSLVPLITISELTFAGRTAINTVGRSDQVWLLVLVIYFLMTYPLSRIFLRIERRLERRVLLGRAT